MSNVNGLIVDGREGLLDGLGFTWWPCKACQRPSVFHYSTLSFLIISFSFTFIFHIQIE